MGLELWMIGKTKEKYLHEGIAEYEKRLSRHVKITSLVIPYLKNASRLDPVEVKRQEADLILQKLKPNDFLILLDERGKMMDSKGFAKFLEDRMMQTSGRTIFMIGGAYGFGDAVYSRAQLQIGLSKMTFSHQLIRLLFWEQLYRGISIIKGLPYHNA